MHPLNQKKHESKAFLTYCNDRRIEKSLASHPFNRAISIAHPLSLNYHLPAPPSFYRGLIRPSQFLDGAALEAFRSGTLTAFTTAHVDIEDCFSAHRGILRLSLTKETYQRAGLLGEKSALSPGKFNVIVDFTADNFINGKLFQRLKLSFDTVFTKHMEVILLTEGDNICPFAELRAQDNTAVQFSEERIIPDWAQVMHAPDKTKNAGVDFDVFNELQEDVLSHIALLSLPSTVPASSDAYVTRYTCPVPREELEHVSSTTMTGCLSIAYVQQVLLELRQMNPPWFTLQIRGFEQTNMAWIGSEHGFLVNGENAITILSVCKTRSHDISSRSDKDVKDSAEALGSLVMWEIVGARDSYN